MNHKEDIETLKKTMTEEGISDAKLNEAVKSVEKHIEWLEYSIEDLVKKIDMLIKRDYGKHVNQYDALDDALENMELGGLHDLEGYKMLEQIIRDLSKITAVYVDGA